MQSYRSNAENPWNLFISNRDAERSECKIDEVKTTGYDLEVFLSSTLPVSFTRSNYIVRCDLCKILVIRNRYKQHYEDRHISDGAVVNMIPFHENVSLEDKTHKIKKIKRNRKKRANFKEKVKYPIDFLEKKKCKKVKVRSINKRHHSKSFLDNVVYFSKSKKLKLEHCDMIDNDKKGYCGTDEGFMSSSSPKILDENFYVDHRSITKKTSFDLFCLNDAVYCSNGSVNRTSSDSSTPPPLSLGTLQTLSSPSSLTILNDPSSVVTEHYFLSSNDLTPERSGVSCKYQIDSLPWENFPSMSIKESDYNLESVKPMDTCIVLRLEEEGDGEVERAVQSITNLCDGFQTDVAMQKQIYEGSVNVDDCQQKLDLFNSDEASMIDCFLDEVLGGSATKEQLLEFTSCASNVMPNTVTSNSNLIDEYSTLSEYQLDSNFLNNFSSEYDEKFETLINNTINEFVTQSPQNICSNHFPIDKRKSYDCFDPLRHCGVLSTNGVYCHRSLLCKLHSMPQKRQVTRPESLTSLIKGIRDFNKSKRLHKKQTQMSDAFKSCNSSKTSSDSFTYNCSSTRSTEEAGSFLENRLSTPDLDVSVLTSLSDSCVPQPMTTIDNTLDPKPLVKFLFNQEAVVHGNRSLVASKSLLWRHRPRSNCHSHRCLQYPSRNINNGHDTITMHHLHTAAAHKKQLSVKNANEISMDSQAYGSHYANGGDAPFGNSGQRSSLNGITHQSYGIQIITSDNDKQHPPRLNNNNITTTINNNNIGLHCLPLNTGQTSASMCFQNIDIALPTNSINFSSPTINNLGDVSNGFFSGCNTQVLNINPHFVSTNEMMPSSSSLSTSFSSSSLNNDLRLNMFSDNNGAFSLANGHNLNDMSSSSLSSSLSSNNAKVISILDEGGSQSSGSILYPVRNNNQIMMVMNNGNRFFGEPTSDNYVSLSHSNQQLTSIPLNSFLTLKHSSGQISSVESGSSLSTPQIVSISPMELQRLSDSFSNPVSGQLLTTDGITTATDKGHNGIIYQLNQPQVANNFMPSSLPTKLDSNSVAKPLTVQSSSVNGVTQKFIILPDGTISAFTQQASPVNTNFSQTSLQQPIFNQLSNYGQNQTYFINNDKIFIAPPTASVPNGIAQHIIMPQIINQSDINTHSSPALTFIHPQHPQQSKFSKLSNKGPQNHLPTQIPVDSSQQKVSFQIQAQNSYPSQMAPNTFFIAAAPATVGSGNIPMKQQILVQSGDHLTSDLSLLDSNAYYDGHCNSQNKPMDNLTCNSDIRGIGSSSQDFDLVNHMLNGQSILIQQQCANRLSTKPTSSIASRSSSVDIATGTTTTTMSLDGAQSSLITNNGLLLHHHQQQQQQHIVNQNEQFAQSQLKFAQRQTTTNSYINATLPQYTSLTGDNHNSSSVSAVMVSGCGGGGGGNVTGGGGGYKTVPPPLVISQQLLNHSITSSQAKQKSLLLTEQQHHHNNHNHHSYQPSQQTQQTVSQLNQSVMDDSQFSNEFMAVQSMIA